MEIGTLDVRDDQKRVKSSENQAKSLLYVSFATINTPYEAEYDKLAATLDQFGLRHECIKVKSLGSWQANTQMKSRVIQNLIQDCPSEPFVYLDVDALVLKQPVLLESLNCDIAAAKFIGWELLSGTVYFGGTGKSCEVVDQWVENCGKYPDTFPGGLLPHFPEGSAAWDQRMLDLAIRETQDVRFVELPPEYTYISDLSAQQYPGVEPVILHTRGRFRFEHLVNQ